jgi:hypothetical protein
MEQNEIESLKQQLAEERAKREKVEEQLKTETQVLKWAIEGAHEYENDLQTKEQEATAWKSAFDSAKENPIRFAFSEMKGKITDKLASKEKENKFEKFKEKVKEAVSLKKETLVRGYQMSKEKVRTKLRDYVNDVQSDYSFKKDYVKIKSEEKVAKAVLAKDKTMEGLAYATGATSAAWNLTGGKIVDKTVEFGTNQTEKFKAMHQHLSTRVLREEQKALSDPDFKPSNSNSVIARAASITKHEIRKEMNTQLAPLKESTVIGFQLMKESGMKLFSKMKEKFMDTAKSLHQGGIDAKSKTQEKRFEKNAGFEM